MATADEILAGAVEVASEDVTQDKVLRIDNELRTIAIPSTVKLLGVESDEDVNRLEFEMPRHYGEFDLSTFSVRVNYMNANGNGDIYRVIDLVADEEMMTFSWLVGRTAFMYKGDVQFVVCLKKIAEDFVVEQEFNTTVASLPVLQGLEPDEQLMQKYPDIIEQILKYMETPVSSEEIGKAVEEYLKENPVGGATINDDEVSAGSVWSSQKTSSQIGERVSEHNMDQTTHADIRNLIVDLTNRLNALADSDDITLDQLSEIVAYIKSNKGLIDAITTSKVSVSDIVDDLITNSSNMPLSAAQGVRLKALIDAIVPITVDSVLSSTSTNPVQNKVILSGLNEKENKGAVRRVQIGDASYAPNASGVVDMSTMTAPDANKLNGKSADEYALMTDLPTKASDIGALAEDAQAADSAKLDGKDSVYYLGARNLLDNSDFRNPVNQRGATSAVSGTYLFDRWIVVNEAFAGNVTAVVSADGTTFTNDQGAQMCCILQRIYDENYYVGKYTAALKTTSGLVIGYIDKDFGGENIHQVTFWIDDGATVVWAALYEGTYTADNLPPYVPEKAVTELITCQQYAIVIGGVIRYRASQITGSVIDFIIPIPIKMRTVPSFNASALTVYGTGDKMTSTAAQTGFEFTILQVDENAMCIRASKTGHGLVDAFLNVEESTVFSANL